MSYFPQTAYRRFLDNLGNSLLQAWVIVLCVAVTLTIVRALQVWWLWPAGFHAPLSDIATVMFQGARFDLKVSAVAATLLLPLLLILPPRFHGWIGGLIAVAFTFLSLINLHYIIFYKVPIDPIVFGFFEDDTNAIVQTIWSDFPVIPTLLVLFVLSWAAIYARKRLYGAISARLVFRRMSAVLLIVVIVAAMLLMVLTIKGTLRAMALGRQNTSVTSSQFLNDMVPNGAIALKFAWDDRKDAQDIRDPLQGLKRLGFDTPMDAAHDLGIEAADESALRSALMVNDPKQDRPRKKNLLFFLMESWSAEPLLYQADDFDMEGRMAPTLSHACHFSNFDSAQPGTHPTLEALLFSTPITPLTLGLQGKIEIPWSTALVFKRAGYHTMFITSARSGWRDLDRILKVQGFDEVIDANDIKAVYPEAELGIWGVWDGYLYKYIAEHLKKSQDGKPVFVFVLTSTNHPPYDLPADYKPPKLNMAKWGGERVFDTLEPNLNTYRYATDGLGALVQEVLSGPMGANTVIAATGDHNARSFGRYVSPERRYLSNQVPFVIWGDGLNCGSQLRLPASHRDMFPTLYPLVGIGGSYVRTGRNLLADPATQQSVLDAPRIISYYGPARNAKGAWNMGDPASFLCTPPSAKPDGSCTFNADEDKQDRAFVGLLDWNVRSGLRKP